MATYDNIHTVHAAPQFPVVSQSNVRKSDDVLYTLSLQLLYCPLQAVDRIFEKSMGAGGGQINYFIVGYAHYGYFLPAYCEYGVGSIVAFEHGTAFFGLQVGCQHGKGNILQKARQFQAAFVKFMVAQCHGVVRHVLRQRGKHGPLVYAVEKGPLKLITRIQGNDVVVLRLGRAYGTSDAAQSAAAFFVIKAGVAILVDARNVGMCIVCMQDGQCKTVFLQRWTLRMRTAFLCQGQGKKQKHCTDCFRAMAQDVHANPPRVVRFKKHLAFWTGKGAAGPVACGPVHVNAVQPSRSGQSRSVQHQGRPLWKRLSSSDLAGP